MERDQTGAVVSSSMQIPLRVCTRHYELRFSTNGKLQSFLNARGEEQMRPGDPGKSFYLLLNMQTEIPLCELEFVEGRMLKCSSSNRSQSVYFEVTARERYCHFKLVRLEGIPFASVLTLHFGANTPGRLRAFDTDYMTFVLGPDGPENDHIEHAHHNALVTRSVSDNDIQVQFESIWNRHPDNPLGSFALYASQDDEEEDDILLEIWANEGLPHPRVEAAWTHERARQWVRDWQRLFAERHIFMLEGESLEELYQGADFAQQCGCNEVYLFTNSWRRGFMSMDMGNCELRSDSYPNGEQDLRAYADHLWERGIRLTIHYVSGGLGPGDPDYVIQPDDRLASYGDFELLEPVGAEDTTIRVRPLHGLELPYLVDDTRAYLRLPGMYRRMFDFHCVRIGDEIIRADRFLNTDQAVWTLEGCERGVNTVQQAHRPGAPVKGMITAYGRMLLPENDSSLLEEVAGKYAGLLNRCRISHAEYDGCEIHNYTGNWGFQKFASLVYERLDHPISAHDSGAVFPKCHIEHRLNHTRKLMEGHCPYTHGSYSVPFTLDSNSRSAVNKLDTHYTLSQGYKGGALGLAKPEPMFGVRPRDMDAHGQTNELIDILRTWREIAANLTPEQRKRVGDSFSYLPERYERSRHLASKNVFLAQRSGDQLSLVPTAVMTREVGDPLWIHGQEHGAIPPKQHVKLDGSLRLENPHTEQVPKFVLRVGLNYDYEGETRSAFDFEDAAGEAEELAHLFEAGNAPDEEKQTNRVDCNLRLDPPQHAFTGQSLTRVEQVGQGAYIFEAHNVDNEEYFEAYKLPAFDCRVDMSAHRAIGMTIEGDGSGSVFAVMIAGRDYVVPIDFTGERYIEIPNGEAAWHEERWGWRMATKHTRYAMVRGFRTGFCRIPPGTESRIRVRDIKLLKELQAPLQVVTLSNSRGSLTLRGNFQIGGYVEYGGGETAVLSDANFHCKQTMAVENSGFVAGTGFDDYRIAGDRKCWIEVQLYTQGEAMVINR